MTFNLLACCAVLLAGTTGVQAQTVYRIVGPDGRVTFSDKAPLDLGKATATSAGGKPVGQAETGLPYELRQIVARYPVTLYTGTNCEPCNAGRMLLQSRGVPFTENTVSTNEDVDALTRISGESTLPFLTIGGQKLKGFSDSEWNQFLSAANYPGTSLLPANYRSPPPKPLVAAHKPAVPPAVAETQATNANRPAEREAVATPQPAANSSNPTGIKF